MNEDVKVNQILNLIPDREGYFSNPHRGRVYETNGISPCLNACSGGNLEVKILIEDEQQVGRNAEQQPNPND